MPGTETLYKSMPYKTVNKQMNESTENPISISSVSLTSKSSWLTITVLMCHVPFTLHTISAHLTVTVPMAATVMARFLSQSLPFSPLCDHCLLNKDYSIGKQKKWTNVYASEWWATSNKIIPSKQKTKWTHTVMWFVTHPTPTKLKGADFSLV